MFGLGPLNYPIAEGGNKAAAWIRRDKHLSEVERWETQLREGEEKKGNWGPRPNNNPSAGGFRKDHWVVRRDDFERLQKPRGKRREI